MAGIAGSGATGAHLMARRRLLVLARYRDDGQHRKIELLASAHDWDVLHVIPARWRDEFGERPMRTVANNQPHLRYLSVPMRGLVNDPHRSTYRSLDLGLRAFQPDAILAEEEPDSLAALQIAIARRLFARNSALVLNTWQNVDRPLRAPARAVISATLRAADAVLCANQAAIALLRKRGYARPTPLIPAVGIDARRYHPAPNEAPGPFRIGYAGRIDMNKGLVTLLDAVAKLSDQSARLVFIGSGPDQAQLDIAIDARGLRDRVTLTGALSGGALIDAIRALHALVLPSRSTPTWQEQFGRVLVEAMACGVPVIGSNSGAIPEVIGDAGLIFPEGDPVALADALAELHTSPARRRQLVALALKRVTEHYTQARVAEKTDEALRKLLNP